MVIDFSRLEMRRRCPTDGVYLWVAPMIPRPTTCNSWLSTVGELVNYCARLTNRHTSLLRDSFPQAPEVRENRTRV